MYCNDVNRKYDLENDERLLENCNLLHERFKFYRASRLAEDIAHFTMLWLKYFRGETTDFEYIAEEIKDNEIYEEEEMKNIREEAKNILYEKYDIEMVSSSPMLLVSKVPFSEIKEN